MTLPEAQNLIDHPMLSNTLVKRCEHTAKNRFPPIITNVLQEA